MVREPSTTKPQQREVLAEGALDIESFDIRGFQERNILKTTAEHFNVRVEYDSNRNIIRH